MRPQLQCLCVIGIIALAGCSESTQPTPATIFGSWLESSTSRPDLRLPAQRCFLFTADSGYIQDDAVLDSIHSSLVPLALERHAGVVSLTAPDTLFRTFPVDDIYQRDGDTLTVSEHRGTDGAIGVVIHQGGDSLTFDYELFVAIEGLVPIHDIYHRVASGNCGGPVNAPGPWDY